MTSDSKYRTDGKHRKDKKMKNYFSKRKSRKIDS